MKRLWSTEELAEQWTLSSTDKALPPGNSDAGKLGLVCQLTYWRSFGRFPEDDGDFAPAVLGQLAAQIDVAPDVIEQYGFTARSARRHRQIVLDHLAIGPFDEEAEAAFRSWLLIDVLPREPAPVALEGEIGAWFARERIARQYDEMVRYATAMA